MLCKIIIKDEVNCKIEGLDLTTRQRLVTKFKYDDPKARYLPSVRLGRWDGKVPYFNLGGSTYVNMLPEIIEFLSERNWEFELDDQRPVRDPFEFTEITEDTFSDKNWPEGHPQAGQPVELRDYQVDIVNRFLENTQCLQEVATGAGKTLMTAALSSMVEPYGRSIVIVPNKSLVTQTERDYRNLGLAVGVYFGDRKELGKTHTICTWQSLNIMLKNTQNHQADVTIHEFLEGVICVIVDEVHMAKADALKTLLTGVMGDIPIRWGLTGTIPKEPFEYVALNVSLGSVVGQLSASELQAAGVLANCHVNIVQTIEHAAFTNYQNELKYLTTNPDRLDYLSGLIAKINSTGNTLVLVDRIESGKELVHRLPDSVFVSGKMKGEDRQDEYDEIATSNNKIIIATYGVAAVGINIPRIFNMVLLEPGKSFVRVIQSIGRGIRKAEDKDFVQIWDITADCKFAKRHLTKRKVFYKDAGYPYNQEKVSYK
jgi:superfamily II DNA or RNA helicase